MNAPSGPALFMIEKAKPRRRGGTRSPSVVSIRPLLPSARLITPRPSTKTQMLPASMVSIPAMRCATNERTMIGWRA